MKERWTSKQGQYLSFIYHYTKVNRRPPAETDLQRFFGVKLEELGLISRTPRTARSIQPLVDARQLSFLE